MWMILFLVLFVLPGLLISIDFISFLVTGKQILNKALVFILELICLVIIPSVFLFFFDFGLKNDCCNDSAFFSPGHRLTIYILLLLCIFFYFYSAYRGTI